jgi:hypothetical protein
MRLRDRLAIPPNPFPRTHSILFSQPLKKKPGTASIRCFKMKKPCAFPDRKSCDRPVNGFCLR